MFIEAWKCLAGSLGRKASSIHPPQWGSRATVPRKPSSTVSDKAAAGSEALKCSPTTSLDHSFICYFSLSYSENKHLVRFKKRFLSLFQKTKSMANWKFLEDWKIWLKCFCARKAMETGLPILLTENHVNTLQLHIQCTVIDHFLMTRRGKSTPSIQYCWIKFSG